MPPRISVILAVKNGLPHLRAAIDGIRNQTCRDFELLVEDGASTDGSLEYLRSIDDLPNVSVVSMPDKGIGQAFNRGLARCQGAFVCIASADEVMEPHALSMGLEWFERQPDAVCVNGTVELVDASGNVVQTFATPHFDVIGHLNNEVVLPFAGLLNRRLIGGDLYYDDSLKTCPDYDFWIRLGMRFPPTAFVAMPEVFKAARADAASMSFRPEAFDQLCQDKLLILGRFLNAQSPSPLVEAVRTNATAGIYLWAAESVWQLEGLSPAFLKWCAAATRLTPFSKRLLSLSIATAAFVVDGINGGFLPTSSRQPDSPMRATQTAAPVSFGQINNERHWGSEYGVCGDGVEIVTGTPAWAYAARVPVPAARILDARLWHWVKVTLQVDRGAIGIGLLAGNALLSERIVNECAEPTVVYLPMTQPFEAVLVRNAHLSQQSSVRLLEASLEACQKDLES